MIWLLWILLIILLTLLFLLLESRRVAQQPLFLLVVGWRRWKIFQSVFDRGGRMLLLFLAIFAALMVLQLHEQSLRAIWATGNDYLWFIVWFGALVERVGRVDVLVARWCFFSVCRELRAMISPKRWFNMCIFTSERWDFQCIFPCLCIHLRIQWLLLIYPFLQNLLKFIRGSFLLSWLTVTLRSRTFVVICWLCSSILLTPLSHDCVVVIIIMIRLLFWHL